MQQDILTEPQKEELGKKIVDIVTGLVEQGSWCNAAKVGTALNKSGISYQAYGFKRLKSFLNVFSDYLDSRDAPSPTKGAPAILEIRVKTAMKEAQGEPIQTIKPIDWAKEHGVKSDFVMKLLRDNGVKVLTQVSKVNASEFEKIEEAVAAEKQKQDACSKNLKTPSSAESESAPAEKKKSATISNTTRNGVKVSLKRVVPQKAITEAKPSVKPAEAPVTPKTAAPAQIPHAVSMKAHVFKPNAATPARINKTQEQNYVKNDNHTIKHGKQVSDNISQINKQKALINVKNEEAEFATSQSAAVFLFGKMTSAKEKIMTFAYFPKDENFSKKNDLFDAITKLSKIALEESWGFGDDKGHNLPILTHFFTYTFERLVYEDEINKKNPNWKPKIRLSHDGKHALFNTGLVDEFFEPVYALFDKADPPNNPGVTLKWVFRDFPNSRNDSMGPVYEYFGNDDNLPKPANYLESNSNSELIYNLNYKISQSNNWNHIITENGIRLPRELLKKSGLKFDFSQFDNPNVDKSNLEANLTDALNNSPECCRSIKSAIEHARDMAVKRVHWNFKTAIPIYYPRTHKICLLLPLYLCNEKKVDAALVLDPKKDPSDPNKGTYIQRTIFPLEMAYLDARLITRPDISWLAPQNIVENGEDDSDED